MKRKLLFMFAALLAVAQGAWADGVVCCIGETNYATLQAAFDASTDGQTIKMLSNVAADNVGLKTGDSRSVTLDLNGHIIDAGSPATTAIYSDLLNSDITIIDSSNGTPGGVIGLVSGWTDGANIIFRAGRYNIYNFNATKLKGLASSMHWVFPYDLEDIAGAPDAQGFLVKVPDTYLYLEVDGTGKNATLKYGTPGENPYYDYSIGWSSTDFRYTVTAITVDASCKNHDVTSFFNLFSYCRALETINDLSNLKTAGVTNMSSMFEECSALTSIDLSSFNTTSVTNMGAMFSYCSSLTTLDLSSFNTANVENMGLMFLYCSNLAVIYVSAGWSTASVGEYAGSAMFIGCEKLPGYDEDNVDVTYAHTGDGGYLNKMAVTAHEGETGEYWTTFYDADRNFIAPTGTKVFKVALSGTHLTMYEVEDRIVNSYMPVVLKSTGANIVMTVSTSSAGDGNPNDLSGWAGPGNKAADGNMYVLNNGTQGVGFYKLKDGKSLSPGKAFLNYTGALAREFFGFDEATGIDATLMNSEKVDGVVYDLQGRRISQPTKGLYIVNGKKYIKK